MKTIRLFSITVLSAALLISCGKEEKKEKDVEEMKKQVKELQEKIKEAEENENTNSKIEKEEEKETSQKELSYQEKRDEKISLKGSELFEKYNCDRCHMVTGLKVGPPLAEIAQAYKGKKEELIKFLKGEAPPKLATEAGQAAHLMNLQLAATKDLTEEELSALADYILSFAEKTD
ncbi:MAG: c-type cytochrome [Aquificae bacterium]|nr:c-type cytochrome [Aquificota bacterium]